MELKKYLEKEGLSQTEFAKKLGVTSARISQIVNRKRNPSVFLMVAIEEITNGNVTMRELFTPEAPSRLKSRKKKTIGNIKE